MIHEIISLYDFTGEACRPWAEAGHTCFAYDIQHPHAEEWKMEWFPSGGSIHYIHADLHDPATFAALLEEFGDGDTLTTFGMAFPVCTDLAVSGAGHFAKKAIADPEFQAKAVARAVMCWPLNGANLIIPFTPMNMAVISLTMLRSTRAGLNTLRLVTRTQRKLAFGRAAVLLCLTGCP